MVFCDKRQIMIEMLLLYCVLSFSIAFSGQSVVVDVKLEREDEEEVSPFVIAPFFPQVSG